MQAVPPVRNTCGVVTMQSPGPAVTWLRPPAGHSLSVRCWPAPARAAQVKVMVNELPAGPDGPGEGGRQEQTGIYGVATRR